MITAQKYYNVARAICRVCTAEHVSVRSVVLTIDADDHAALIALAGEYPMIKYRNGELKIFDVLLTPDEKREKNVITETQTGVTKMIGNELIGWHKRLENHGKHM